MVCAGQCRWPMITVVKKGGKLSKGTADVNPLQAPASKLPARYNFALRDISWPAAEAEGSSLPESTSTDASLARRNVAGYTGNTALSCPVPPWTLCREDATTGHKH